MSDSKEVSLAKPKESLVPKAFTPWLVLSLVLGSIGGMVLASVGMDKIDSGPLEDFLMVLVLICLVVYLVSMVLLVRAIISARKKLGAANRKIAEALRWKYNYTVLHPKTLILTDQSKPRLNPYDIPATDAYGRTVNIRISPDETGTTVVASICEEHPDPAADHPYERH